MRMPGKFSQKSLVPLIKPTHVTNSLTKLDFHVDVDVNVNVNVNANVGVNVDVKNKFY